MTDDYREFTAQIAERLRELRKERGLSQFRVAADNGISLSVIHNMESGQVGLRSLFRVAKIYGVQVCDIVRMEKRPRQKS